MTSYVAVRLDKRNMSQVTKKDIVDLFFKHNNDVDLVLKDIILKECPNTDEIEGNKDVLSLKKDLFLLKSNFRERFEKCGRKKKDFISNMPIGCAENFKFQNYSLTSKQ